MKWIPEGSGTSAPHAQEAANVTLQTLQATWGALAVASRTLPRKEKAELYMRAAVSTQSRLQRRM